MTDEQLKVAAPSAVLMELVGGVYLGSLTTEGASQYTADVIRALQKDGQYIVFQAPVGYRFQETASFEVDDMFPSFSCIDQTVMPVGTGRSLAGAPGLRLAPLTGGVE